MSALTITPARRYAELLQHFRSLVTTSRRKRLSTTQVHHLAMAASKQQVAETAILERALGADHDRAFIEGLKIEVQSHLTAAGVRI